MRKKPATGAFGQQHGTRRSRSLLRALSGLEAPEVMDHQSDFPVVLSKATGARVQDVDGNRYIDLGGFFGVAVAGHRNRAVVAALRKQAGRLLHGMGDVHPTDTKARFLSRLSRCLPASDYRAVLSLNGSDAVECALKFAAAATGRPGVIAFEGAYHGLTAGALEVTAHDMFRRPFAPTLQGRGSFVPFPTDEGEARADRVLKTIREKARSGEKKSHPIGAIIVEPIQGRGGIRVPPPGFLADLSDLAGREGLVLIADEIYSGVGRTGTFLAGDHEGLVPDVVCLGKSLGGGMPLSACLLRQPVAEAVQGTPTEAVHTSTFLGHPLACAAGLAVLGEMERRDLYTAATRIGTSLMWRARSWKERFAGVRDVRGRGAMVGVELADRDGGPGSDAAMAVCDRALNQGVILLPAGGEGNVLTFTPPLVITGKDLDRALDTVEEGLKEVLD
ncbi:MAG: aspartate aminotransferase family protein [Deltaproteobacteria bacterium]|nr:aspartate aminotransferase family protein [Deltaproteobacteria bacterium]